MTGKRNNTTGIIIACSQDSSNITIPDRIVEEDNIILILLGPRWSISREWIANVAADGHDRFPESGATIIKCTIGEGALTTM
mmetsp:Transcript_15996/g.44032  ORF Transcript_15996/g.44032 Transcript_15996/m.44032 type:complete len:82 (+) Transcript_15996:153-398(+)